MKGEKKRLFVGNLPPNSTEDLLNKKFKKYGNVLSVELKRRADGTTFAFLDLETNPKDLELCLDKIQQKPWDGHEIKVQLAKESFLSRLERERELAKNNSVSPGKSKQLENWIGKEKTKSTHVNGISPSKTFNSLEESAEENERRRNWKHSKVFNNENSDFSREIGRRSRNEHSDLSNGKRFDSSDEDEEKEEKKGNIPMFRGTLSLVNNKVKTNNNLSEVDLLQRFESFSDVWKDDPSDQTYHTRTDQGNKNAHSREMLRKTFEVKKSVEIPDESHRKTIAEERRLKSIAERKKSFLQRKQTIQSALTKIDTRVRNSKKIKLDSDASDDDVSFPEQTIAKRNSSEIPESSSKREKLFSEDESENENNDFKIKSQFEGQKGQKLLALQARYANDKRFTLDERFYESDDDAEEATPKGEEAAAEKKKQLQILGSILGQELIAPMDKSVKQKRKSMLRFDPTKPDHVKYEVKQTPNEPEEKESKLDEKTRKKAKSETAAAVVETIPSVSKDKYYEVSDTLKESLKHKNDKFSLLDMFGSEDLKEDEETHQEVQHKGPKSKKQIGWSSNPFKYDSSESEDEEEQKPVPVDKAVPRRQSVWHEPFFFAPDDIRLQQGVYFLTHKAEDDEDFETRRRELKRIIRLKVKNNLKKQQMWKKKLGGKWQHKNHVDKRKKQNFKRNTVTT